MTSRVLGRKDPGGALVEALLLKAKPGRQIWEALLKPARRLNPGQFLKVRELGGKAEGFLVLEKTPQGTAWLEWTPDLTRQRAELHGGEVVETWCEVTAVDGELVTFRWTNHFASDGATVVSDSTLRFRSRAAIERSLDAAGYELVDVRDAPDRPGREMVFIARTR